MSLIIKARDADHTLDAGVMRRRLSAARSRPSRSINLSMRKASISACSVSDPARST
jgi:hypothetical protein